MIDLEERERALAERERILAEKETLVAERLKLQDATVSAISGAALSRVQLDFWSWLKRFGAIWAAMLAILGYLGLKISVDTLVTSALKVKVTEQIAALETRLDDIDIDTLQEEFYPLQKAAAETAKTLEQGRVQLATQTEALARMQETIDRNELLSAGAVSRLLRNVITQVNGDLILCGKLSEEELLAGYGDNWRVTVKTAGQFKQWLGGYDRFVLSRFNQNRYLLDSYTDVSENGHITCLTAELEVRSAKGSPLGMVSNEIRDISFFRVGELKLNPDNEAAEADEVAFRRFWGDVSVLVYLRVNGNGDGFGMKGSDVYHPDFWYHDAEAEHYSLSSVNIDEITDDDGDVWLVADVTPLQTVSLEDIQNRE